MKKEWVKRSFEVIEKVFITKLAFIIGENRIV